MLLRFRKLRSIDLLSSAVRQQSGELSHTAQMGCRAALGRTMYCLALAAATLAGPTPSALAHDVVASGACELGGLAMTVPWVVGGPRIEPDGTLRNFPGDWPDLPVERLRLWDTRTAWLDLEPADDAWNFERLDAILATAASRGVWQVTLVLAGTPRWAASRGAEAGAAWLGPGSASPPRDLDQWRQFVRTIAVRYAGRIAAYEIWNEPTSRTFFTGTPVQWAAMVAVAAEEIRMTDPGARVLASGFSATTRADVRRLQPWLAALADARPRLDGLSIHWYPRSWAQVRGLAGVTSEVRASATRLGLPADIWVSEANARVDQRFPGGAQGQVVRAMIEQARRARVQELAWYAWLDLPTSLMPIHRGSPVVNALRTWPSCPPE